MMADPKLLKEGERVAEEMAALWANPKLQKQVERIADQMGMSDLQDLRFVDKLVDRSNKAAPLHLDELDDATLGKPFDQRIDAPPVRFEELDDTTLGKPSHMDEAQGSRDDLVNNFVDKLFIRAIKASPILSTVGKP